MILEGREPQRRRRGGARREHRRARRLRARRRGLDRHLHRGPRRARRRWSASPASATAARSTARRTPASTPRPPSSCSSTARTPSTSVWVTADDGVSPGGARPSRPTRVLPDGPRGGDRRRRGRGDAPARCSSGIDFLTTFLLIFAGIALVVSSYIIVNTFSILVAQRSRELALLRALGASKRQVIRSVQLEAFAVGVLGSTLGLGLGVVLAMGIRALVATFGLDLAEPAADPGARGPSWRRTPTGIVVTMVAGLAAGPADRPDRAGPGAARRRRAARVVACAAGCCSGSR